MWKNLVALAGLSGSLCAQAAVPTEGLVAYYCFEDPAHLTQDCSTQGNNGIQDGEVLSVAGYKGKGALFGGYYNPAVIRVPNASSLQFDNNGAFSVAFAVNLTSFGGMDGYGGYTDHGLHSVVAKSHDQAGMALGVWGDAQNSFSSGAESFEWYGNGNTVSGHTKNRAYRPGQWIHVAYVFSNLARTATLFIDGQRKGRNTAFQQDFASINGQDLYIGRYSDWWYPLNGTVDEVRIYNRALKPREIKALVADR